MKDIELIQGNEACVEAALKAGIDFYAGYPISPSTEITELFAQKLIPLGKKFIQMEDEIASMAAIIGASLTGKKVMTATSGPGFTLMQENIGFAAATETPCVVINVQRAGPSTGLPTTPAQGDMMQARWGSHGDYSIIALVPYSVRECFDLTVRAFNLAEKYRTPVIVLMDEIIGHMRENVKLPDTVNVVNRAKPVETPDDHIQYKNTEDLVPPMATLGTGYKFHVTGLTHDEQGFPTSNPTTIEKFITRINEKIHANYDDIVDVQEHDTEDSEYLFFCYGSAARSCYKAYKLAREQGIKVGIMRPRTIWPFPKKHLQGLKHSSIKKIIVPELNRGQIVREVEASVTGIEVIPVNKYNGELFTPQELLDVLKGVR
ncbi:2-oxoacid:acceptor oxidoreductase subunit alpha [Desulfuribacillus alkaliarsenatis]|uniref:2-oxoglutarate synthase subunit alpha n=1 Tax=Desulfuribacillus alkaliarsenatis TaxID=766136 RepID=A0A1E5G7H2_9FIRM|nr:2-oxoacid:acceptor oxidoreductase subunit alpha [Desulfuribacillus alkaliarsenatis]OEF98684.1 2-oxoglutarate synthase subunit alpha [Desulfuribacillus alkaliarsenatis]